jgi:hypothetical protein
MAETDTAMQMIPHTHEILDTIILAGAKHAATTLPADRWAYTVGHG